MVSEIDWPFNVTAGGKTGAKSPWDTDQVCVELLKSCEIGGNILEGRRRSRLTSREKTQKFGRWRSCGRKWVGSVPPQMKRRWTGSSQRSFRSQRSLFLLPHRRRCVQKILLNEHKMVTPKMGKLVISCNRRKTFSAARYTLTN